METVENISYEGGGGHNNGHNIHKMEPKLYKKHFTTNFTKLADQNQA